jgi:hypothetical protein
MRAISRLIFITIVSVYTCPEIVLAQNSAIRWSSFNSGSGASSQSTTNIISSTGQLLVGASQQNNSRVESGFLSAYLVGDLIVGVEEQIELPSTFSLSQNFPNPFNPSTTIQYELAGYRRVELRIFNMLGQEVVTLVNEEQNSGRYTIEWNGRNKAGIQVPSGIYIYRLQAYDVLSDGLAAYSETRKAILLK